MLAGGLHCLVLTDTILYNLTKGKNLTCKSRMASDLLCVCNIHAMT